MKEEVLNIPYKREVTSRRTPMGNYIVMALAVIIFSVQFTYDYKQQYLGGLILSDWTVSALVGHMWLHANVLHFTCNLVLLGIFGRAVCLRIGNVYYPIVYFVLGICSGAIHIIYDGRPAIATPGPDGTWT